MRRRNFLATPLAAGLASSPSAAAVHDSRVYAFGDGIPHTPQEYARILLTLAESGNATKDDFSRGGVVEQLEARMAAALGKEMAVWMPTGTLANHVAIRLLAGSRRRVVVQAVSHLFCDSGDCAQTLSGLHLVPLAPGRAGFSLPELERASTDSQFGRVATPIGAISIETPVRRRSGERFDFEELTKIAAWARSRNIGLHLDGARLFIESAYTGRSVREYASLADTVYISMYKCFNAGSGAILAGPKVLLSDLYHTRRMFGGGLPHSWPFAAVALHYLQNFETRFKSASTIAEQAISNLKGDGNFEFERVTAGTNIFRLRAASVNAPVYQLRLEEAGISAQPPSGDWISLTVNETWSRVTPEELVRRFRKALG